MVSKSPSQPPGAGPQWCPTCGSKLVGGDCVECDRPRSISRGIKLKAVPARAYNEPTTPVPEPAPIDARRSTAEWMTQPTDDAPSTRRAHPTQVRMALAEAEEKARAKSAASPTQGQVARPTTRPRVRVVTPLPPEPPPEAVDTAEGAAPVLVSAPEPAPAVDESLVVEPAVAEPAVPEPAVAELLVAEPAVAEPADPYGAAPPEVATRRVVLVGLSLVLLVALGVALF